MTLALRASLAETAGATLTHESFGRIVNRCQPVLLRGLVDHWPAVAAARRSPVAFRDYLAGFDDGGTMEVFAGAPAIGGKYFYDADLTGFNFARRSMRFGAALDAIIAGLDQPGSESLYVGSVPVTDYLPGFAADNAMPLVPAAPRIWLGHAGDISAHYDTVDNLACVVAGRRRFTLYAPTLVNDL
jgi:hypothetical protein